MGNAHSSQQQGNGGDKQAPRLGHSPHNDPSHRQQRHGQQHPDAAAQHHGNAAHSHDPSTRGSTQLQQRRRRGDDACTTQQPQPSGEGPGPDGSGGHSRVLVDIQGADLDNNYSVWIQPGDKQPQRSRRSAAVTAEAVEGGVLSVSGTLQALGGVLITILTIQKLVEEVRVIRALRRSARDAGGGGGADARDRGDEALPEQRLLPPLGPDFGMSALGAGQAAAGGAAGAAGGCQDSWARISGLRETKMLLQEATVLPLLRPDLFWGVREPPKGVLLYGPPGTGKTMLARAVAAESGAAFIAVTGSSILSKWYGESEGNVRRLFEDARRLAPSVVFIDEVDSLLGRRAGAGGDGAGGAGEASRRVTNEFLSFIDGIHTPAAAQAGGRGAGAAIVRGAMPGVACEMTDADWRRVAEATAGYSGRDLTQVCREASMRPLRELWGNRVLEGGAPRHAQRQRQLVRAVAAALRRGVPRRRMRRELEKWKKAEAAAAAWCDVDAVISEAEQSNAAAPPPAAAIAAAGAASCAKPLAQAGQQQQQDGEEEQRRLKAAGELDSGDFASVIADGAAVRTASASARPSSSDLPDQADVFTLHADGQSAQVHEKQEEGQQQQQQQGQQQQQQPAESEQVQERQCRQHDDSSSSCAGTGSTADAAISTVSNGGSGDGSSKGTWTVEELLSLPADSMRPVVLSDFEGALQSVGSTDFDLTAKFEGWSAKHGSGGGTKRRDDAWRSMPMYL